jgi:acyl carrier protein
MQEQETKSGASKELDQKPTAVSNTPTLELLSGIMEEIGHPVDMNDLDKVFFAYGMDSLELVIVRKSLSAALDVDLPATLLLDFPTARELSQELDRERGVGLGKEDATLEGASATNAAREKADLLEVHDVLAFQDMCRKTYALPSHQANFTKLAQRCFPDMLMYLLAIEELLVEAEGPILLEAGIISNMHPRSIRSGRALITASLNYHWSAEPELQRRSRQLLQLTKQDQRWQ